ncbi:aKG-HExxH-type peptide beta-hydroxylase [Actinoplanes sp. HUAS TT8]|uniref:aKG-HExxH-type peptide beta-hydroxylase n=1 Tax=Actinoplanes sp. HUAS TT8 TaxID=3447453 RepID=UPI003F52451B
MTLPARRHRLSSAQVTDIAWGRPDSRTIQALYAADDSRQRLLTVATLRRHGREDRTLVDALSVLEAARQRDDRCVTELLRIGWVGPWAAGQLVRPDAAKQVANPLGTLAAAAALRTGIDARLPADVVAGELHLPGIGTLAMTGRPDSGVILDVHDNRIDFLLDDGRLPLPVTRTHDWSPARSIEDGGLRLLFDDRHPGRDCFNQKPEQPLPENTFHRWRQVIIAAWRLLSRTSPVVANQVAQGMRVVVPLAPSAHGVATSISCADALGAIASTAPSDPAEFAVALVHEWSHTMLNGLLGFLRLHEPTADRPQHVAPWRPDLRPISGVLHGTYAFMAVAETWRDLLAHDGRAATEFARRRIQLAEVLATLPTVPALTDQGRRFVEILRQRHATLMDVALPSRAVAEATARIDEQRASWARRRTS